MISTIADTRQTVTGTALYERLIQQRTFGRISRLAVEVSTDRQPPCIFIRGRAGRYYEKQLAQQALLEMGGNTEIVNEIEVGSGRPRRV